MKVEASYEDLDSLKEFWERQGYTFIEVRLPRWYEDIDRHKDVILEFEKKQEKL